MRLPNSRRQSLTCDVTEHQSKKAAKLYDLEEVSGQMTYCEDFAGDLKFAPNQFTGRAEPSLDLRRLVDGLLEFRVFTAHCFEFLFRRSSRVREGCGLR